MMHEETNCLAGEREALDMIKDSAKRILCFGDSNTFGTNPSGGRWPRSKRWPGRLQQILGEDYDVVEEGCGGRTTVFEDTLELHKNGRSALPVALASHKPLDLVIIMLGTNDMKHRFAALPCDIANGAAELVRLVQTYPYGPAYRVPQVLLISPILLGEDIEHSIYTGFSQDAYETSKQLAPWFQKKAEECGCLYLDAAQIARPSERDQLHMEAEDHDRLAQHIAALIRRTFEDCVEPTKSCE